MLYSKVLMFGLFFFFFLRVRQARSVYINIFVFTVENCSHLPSVASSSRKLSVIRIALKTHVSFSKIFKSNLLIPFLFY